MREYAKFGLGPITTRWDADGYGWTHITDQAHNAMVWLLSPCGTGALTIQSPRERWKQVHRAQRMVAKNRLWQLRRGQIGHISGVRVIRSESFANDDVIDQRNVRTEDLRA